MHMLLVWHACVYAGMHCEAQITLHSPELLFSTIPIITPSVLVGHGKPWYLKPRLHRCLTE